MSADGFNIAEELRRRAEALLAASPEAFPPAEIESMGALAHELSVYQAELELQNRELGDAQAELQQSRDRYAELFEHAPVGYLMLDASGIIRRANATWASMLGRSMDDSRDIPFADTLCEEDALLFRSRFRAFFRQPSEKQLMARIKRRDGSRFPARIEARPRDGRSGGSDGSSSELMVIVSDISDLEESRREVEVRNDELGRLNDRLDHVNRVLLGIRNVNQIIVAEHDPARLIDRSIGNLIDAMGYESAWIVLFGGDSGRSLGLPDEGSVSAVCRVELRKDLERGVFPACVNRVLEAERKTLSIRPASECTDCSLSSDYRGRVVMIGRLTFEKVTYGVLAVTVDSTYSDGSEEQGLFDELTGDLAFALHKIADARRLDESRRRYRELFEHSRDGLVMVDVRGRIIDANDAYCEMLGYSRKELQQFRDFHQITPDRWHAWESTEIWEHRLLRLGSSGLYEKEYIRKDGSVFPVEMQAYAVRRADGEIDYLWGTVRDITARKRAEESLQRERQWLDFVIRGAGLGTWEWNVQTDQTVFNDTWATMLGYTLDELTPYDLHTWERLVHPDDLELATATLRRCIEGETSFYDCEFRMRHKDGSWIWILDRGRIMARDAEGNPLSMFGTHADITKIKEAGNAIRESEERFRALVEASPMSVMMVQNGRYIYANPAGARLMGYKHPEELIGIDALKSIASEHHEMVRERMRRVESGKNNQTVKLKLIRPDGRKVWVLSTSVSIPIGGVRTAIIVGQDITQLVRTEEALERNRQELQAVYDSAPVMLCVVDERRRIRYANPAFSTLVGTDRGSLRNEIACGVLGCINALESPDGCGTGAECADCALLLALEDTLSTGASHSGIERRLTIQRDGARKELAFLGATATIPASEEKLALLCLSDVTDRWHMQEQLLQSQKMESIGRLAGGVAHDFNNMLSVILGRTEMMLEKPGIDDPLRAELQEVREAAGRSADLTRQLLAFARKQTIAPTALNLNEAVSSMLKMLERLIGEDIDLLWKPDPGIAPVLIDPGQVDQMLANLAVNSRDAIGHRPGKVTIETAGVDLDAAYCADHAGFSPGRYVMLAVSDDGCGMDQETCRHVFEPFFTTKPSSQGTGLGLATVYGIVKQNDGFINVYSEPGVGSTFKIYLPRYRVSAGGAPGRAAGTSHAGGGETILLVEDEPAILSMTKTMLERAGYTVEAAGTPGEAIEVAKRHSGDIHLLISDVVMPEMNGRDLARNILSLFPDIRCLFMSGYTANVIAHHGVLEEGVNFIQKPYAKNDLTAKVREALDRDSGGDGSGNGT